jgi:hypothetical protein
MPLHLKGGSFSVWHLSINRADAARRESDECQPDPVHNDPPGSAGC